MYNLDMGVLTFFILATYAAQIIQIYFFSVPSAGSTVEMLFKVKKIPRALITIRLPQPSNRVPK